ncbi:MAG: pyridoxamine 5'-phosphate oxidase family protein [Candidatus Thiodiazotropha sp.]
MKHKVYHEGEIAIQSQNGVEKAAQMTAAAIQNRIPHGAMSFIAQQSTAVIGTLDSRGKVWASLVFGMPGFLQAFDGKTLRLTRSSCHTATGDPLWNNLDANSQLGILLIELSTRRRLRINGRVLTSNLLELRIQVEQAYANCPKYIQRRHLKLEAEKEAVLPSTEILEGKTLDSRQQTWISKADTFFVASAHLDHGMDASHRGGHPGFVKLLSPQRLRIPDFIGNNMFNTLGNFTSYPHAGLVFIDFDQGKVLQLSGRPEILTRQPDEQSETGGTDRYWEFEIEWWRESDLPIRIRADFVDYSPYLPKARNARSVEHNHDVMLKVERTWMASPRVKCIELTSIDGMDLPPFTAGAHLKINILNKWGAKELRFYSLLSDPACRERYRIGVLVEPHGRGGSLFLHEKVQPGDTLEAVSPENNFALAPEATHSTLIAGGIGITPLMSMLYSLKAGNCSYELHYSAKSKSELAFKREIEHVAGARAHFYTSRDNSGPSLDLETLVSTPTPGTHIYVCGPYCLIQAVRDRAKTLGWPPEQIHFESFGTANTVSNLPITVTLAKSGKTVDIPSSRSILDVLLNEGITIPHNCKRGECSLCVTRVLKGKPQHRDFCLSADEQKHSMCLCVSRARTRFLTLNL